MWIIDTISFLWIVALLIYSLRLIRHNKVLGIGRSELIALVVLITSSLVTYTGTFVFGGILNITHASWRAPSVLVVGLSVVTVLFLRNEMFDLGTIERDLHYWRPEDSSMLPSLSFA